MQNYLDQLAKLNELLAQPPLDPWAILGVVVMFAVTVVILFLVYSLLVAASPFDTLFKAGLGIETADTRSTFRRFVYLGAALLFFVIAMHTLPFNKTAYDTRELERAVHNTLMDMNEVDYKTLVKGTYRYKLSDKDQSRYQTLIKIIKEASKRRPVQ